MRSASFTTTIIIALSLPFSHAFQASRRGVAPVPVTATRSTLFAAKNTNNDASPSQPPNNLKQQLTSSITAMSLFLSTATTLTVAPTSAHAVSGGGLDYAGLDISNQDYSNGNYKGKDFTQVIAKAATFVNSNLQGCRFYKAYLVSTNFEGADARGASFEDTSMDDANLKNIIAVGSYFGQSLLDVKTMEGGDFTDAQIPIKTLKLVCDREDVKGSNPVTGVDTRDSLMCL